MGIPEEKEGRRRRTWELEGKKRRGERAKVLLERRSPEVVFVSFLGGVPPFEREEVEGEQRDLEKKTEFVKGEVESERGKEVDASSSASLFLSQVSSSLSLRNSARV